MTLLFLVLSKSINSQNWLNFYINDWHLSSITKWFKKTLLSITEATSNFINPIIKNLAIILALNNILKKYMNFDFKWKVLLCPVTIDILSVKQPK
jgi:hypothetical protein